MRQLFTVAEILTVTGGRLLQGSPATSVTGFAYDSRKVAAGDCFVAMPGERVDGHDYAAKAAAAGAVCVLAGRSVDLPPETALVVADDPLIALGQLGRHHRDRHPVKVVGVTGSLGKTTTKELIAAVLSVGFNVFRSVGNFNSEVGLPITLMNLTPEHEMAVLEMGMRALGEIEYLVSIAHPTIGVVTNVGITHLEVLGTQENIARAKGELIRNLPKSGAAVLNADDPRVVAMTAEAPDRIWYYGETAGGRGSRWATARAIRRDGDLGQRFTLVTSAGDVEAYLPAPGTHNVWNATAAAAVGLELGMSLPAIAEGIGRYAPSGNRMRIINTGGIRLLDDTYNAAPLSVTAALQVMRDLGGTGRCVAVLGDMFELGEETERAHRQVGEAAGRLADVVFTLGNFSRTTSAAAGARAAGHYQEKPALILRLQRELRPGDTVLVKGSRGMAMEEIVRALENDLSAK